MTDLPTGYHLRAPAIRDSAAIADVIQAHDIADFGEPDFTEGDLVDDWLRPRFTLGSDAWVLIGPTGRIIGYASVWESQPDREFEGDAFVLPEYSGRGLGGQLLELMEHRAVAVGAGRAMNLGVFASTANEEKRNLLERRGFQYARSVLRMRADLNRDPADDDAMDGEAPAGVAIRSFVPADENGLRVVWLDAFASHGRFSPRGVEEWFQSRFDHPAFDPLLWRVATVDDEVVGAVLVFDVGETGYTSTVAIRAEARGRGIGPALLRSAFAVLRDRGQMRVMVSLDADAEPALLGLYEAAGMRVHERHDLFIKPIS